MAEEEDDYLSDKFLQKLEAASKASSSKSYSQRRKDAQRDSEIRNITGRMKSRKQIEEETMETLREGMNTSLFEKEKMAASAGGTESKAMKMMSRMGFKPGQSLGRKEEKEEQEATEDSRPEPAKKRVAPIAINLWEGKKGLGAMKRPLSPDSVAKELERAAKTARRNEEATKDTFRSKAREEYEEKRAEGRLISAQKTCVALDDKVGVAFNILTLNPRLRNLIPEPLRDQLDIDLRDAVDDTFSSDLRHRIRQDNLERLDDHEISNPTAERLRRAMQRDALTSSNKSYDLADDDEPLAMKVPPKDAAIPEQFSEEQVQQANEFLHLPATERLQRVLHYLREKYFFCFWCGVEYNDKDDMDANCPGETEELHD